MERKHNCKRMVAWLLTIAMVFGNSSFAALAEETAPAEAAAVQAEAIQIESTVPAGDAAAVETSEFAPAEDAAIAEAPEDAAAENTAAAEEEDALIEDEADAPEEGSEADVPVEEAAPEAEGILLEGMEVVPEGLAPMAEEGEDEEEPAFRLEWLDFGSMAEDGETKGDWTWVYTGDTKEIGIAWNEKEQTYDKLDMSLMLRTDPDDNGAWEELDLDDNGYINVAEAGGTITITGLQEVRDSQWLLLNVTAYNGEEEIGSGWMNIEVRKPVEEYWLDIDEYRNTVFPGDRFYLNRVCYQIETPEHPYGIEGDDTTEITDVTYKQYTQDEEGNEIETDDIITYSGPDENGDWYLEVGETLGYVKYTVSFTSPTGEKKELPSKIVYVSGDVWNLDFEYPNYEDDSMLPGDTMTIHTTLCHEWRHGDDQGYEEPEDYELSVPEDQDFGTLKVSVDGRDITVKAGDDWCWRSLEAFATVDGEEVARNSFSVNVQADGYSLLRVDNMDQVNNLAPGKSVTIDPELVFISPKGDEVVQDDVKYCMEFDPDMLTVTDVNSKSLLAGSEDGKPVIGTAPLTITKKTNDNTDAQLIAMSMNEDGDYEERYRINLHFWEQNCSVRYVFDGADGDGYNASVPIFTDGDKVITADTSHLQEMGVDYEIVWKVGRVEEGERQILEPLPADDGYYTAVGDTLILHGAELAKKYPPFNENEEEDDNSRFDVRAQVLVNGNSVWEEDGPGFEMREPQEWFNPPLQGMNDKQTFPNGTIQFDAKTTYYIENAMYPYGAELEATITDVKIIKNMTWTDEGDEIEAEKSLFTVKGSADDGWTLTASDEYGFVYLGFTYEVNSPEKIVGEYGFADDDSDDCFRVDITNEKWYFELEDMEEELWLHSGEKKTISTRAWKEYLDENGEPQTENVGDYELRFTDGEDELSYNPEVISVEDISEGKFTINVHENCAGKESGLNIQFWGQTEDDGPWSELGLYVRVGCTDDKHGSGEWRTIAAPTCTVAGMQILYCEYCGYDLHKENELMATGHTEAEKLTKVPTCTEPGMRTQYCEVCGYELENEEIAATGHSWGGWSALTEATIFAASTRSRTCTVCKKQETQTLGAKLTPVLKLTANSLKMKTKQTTKKFLVTEIANGDSVASVTSSNTKVLKVKAFNSGTGTFTLAAQKKKGKANLTITLASGLSKTIKVTVQSAKVKTTKVALDKASKKITLSKGKKYTLKPTVTPVTSQDKISYTSSNKAVAAVSSKGVITAKKKGKAKITIKSGKKKVICTVTVK